MSEASTSLIASDTRAPLVAGGPVTAIIPTSAEQAYRMAQMISLSGLAPKDMRTPEQIVTAILTGLEIGLKPMQAVQAIAVINGRPCVWGDAALGLVMGSGLVEDIDEQVSGDGDATKAVCSLRRKGKPTPIVREFSWADAKRAGLANKTGPWTQYPKRMLQMRARAWALRDGFPDVLKGLHVTEEVRDYDVRPQKISTADSDQMKRQLIGAGDPTDRDEAYTEIESIYEPPGTAMIDEPIGAPTIDDPPPAPPIGTAQAPLAIDRPEATPMPPAIAKINANTIKLTINSQNAVDELDEYWQMVADMLDGIRLVSETAYNALVERYKLKRQTLMGTAG